MRNAIFVLSLAHSFIFYGNGENHAQTDPAEGARHCRDHGLHPDVLSVSTGTDPNPPAASSDAYLSSLVVSIGATAKAISPSFVATTLSYSVNVPTATTQVTIAATANDSGASVQGTGTLVLGDAGTSTPAEIIVTAGDGITQKTYTVTVNRAALAASTDATLADLSVSNPITGGMAITPGFDPAAFSYSTYPVTNNISSVTISATANDSGATVSGAGSSSLSVGSNTLDVIVTAADGATTSTYSIAVERYGPESTRLSALTASEVSFAFNPDTRTYYLNAPNAISTTTIAATTEYSGSTMEMDIGGGFVTFDGSEDVSLVAGEMKTITIQVTSQYASDINTYELNITRAASGASADATLSALTLEGGDFALSPAFSSGTYSYTAT
ncbi:MAG: cadherin-like beta sandwich domain-containing protein, partial [Spirochaetales bacterium]